MSELFLPTPGRLMSSFCVCGTLPSNFSINILDVASMFLDLALNRPAGLIASIISSLDNFNIPSGVSASANSCLQATAVRLSCDCADSITPIKLVYAFEYILDFGFLFE
jgi:hypothetical protein